MPRPKKKTISKVEMVKAKSRELIGSVKPSRKIEGKKKKPEKYRPDFTATTDE